MRSRRAATEDAEPIASSGAINAEQLTASWIAAARSQ